MTCLRVSLVLCLIVSQCFYVAATASANEESSLGVPSESIVSSFGSVSTAFPESSVEPPSPQVAPTTPPQTAPTTVPSSVAPAGTAPCRPCAAADGAQCTHPGNADQAWCDANCPDGVNGAGCPASHCFCGVSVPRVCRPCAVLDLGCTHPGVADQGWCDAHCPRQVNDAVCVASHCYCAPSSARTGVRTDHVQRVFATQAIDKLMQGVNVSVAQRVARYPIETVSVVAGAFLTFFVVVGVAWRRATRSSSRNVLSKRADPKASSKSPEGSPNPSGAAANTSPASFFVRRRPPLSP